MRGLGYLYGMWPFLEWDAQDHRTELRLALDLGDEIHTPGLHLAEGRTVRQAVQAFIEQARWQARRAGIDLEGVGAVEAGVDWDPLINMVLYLAAENADLTRAGQPARPTRPTPTKTRRGYRLFPPQEPRSWEVGYRIGAALRRASQATDGASTGIERQGPRPHIRRAHWHTLLPAKIFCEFSG